MTSVGIFEAKNRLSELVERAGRGEEIIITRRGEQIARLVAPQAPDATVRAQQLAARIRQTRNSHPLGDGAPLGELIRDGRR